MPQAVGGLGSVPPWGPGPITQLRFTGEDPAAVERSILGAETGPGRPSGRKSASAGTHFDGGVLAGRLSMVSTCYHRRQSLNPITGPRAPSGPTVSNPGSGGAS